MATQLKVPALGESIKEATLGAWLKQEGEAVDADEPLVEVESEKATIAVPAPSAGKLVKILKPSGATVAIGEPIAEFEKGEGRVAAKAEAKPEKAAPPRANGNGAALQAPAPAPAPAAAEHVARRAPPPPPSVRRMMAEGGLAAEAVHGSGREGQITRDDVVRALQPAPAPAPAGARPPGDRERAIPMSPLRRTIARRLLEAQQNAAILTTFNEVDMGRVLALREQHQKRFQERYGVKLGFMSFFVKAAIEALKAFPAVNAEIRGNDMVYKDHYDVGVAVGGGKGLVVPVVRDADLLSFAEVELEIGELAKRARENKLTMEELEGGTFTISNGGVYGSMLSTPILNPPQSGILGLHKIQKRAMVSERDEIVARPMMYLALSYDHRLVDGREAVSFLVRVKECIEDPERMLLEI